MRRCNKCEVVLELYINWFFSDSKGRRYICKTCSNKINSQKPNRKLTHSLSEDRKLLSDRGLLNRDAPKVKYPCYIIIDNQKEVMKWKSL